MTTVKLSEKKQILIYFDTRPTEAERLTIRGIKGFWWEAALPGKPWRLPLSSFEQVMAMAKNFSWTVLPEVQTAYLVKPEPADEQVKSRKPKEKAFGLPINIPNVLAEQILKELSEFKRYCAALETVQPAPRPMPEIITIETIAKYIPKGMVETPPTVWQLAVFVLEEHLLLLSRKEDGIYACVTGTEFGGKIIKIKAGQLFQNTNTNSVIDAINRWRHNNE